MLEHRAQTDSYVIPPDFRVSSGGTTLSGAIPGIGEGSLPRSDWVLVGGHVALDNAQNTTLVTDLADAAKIIYGGQAGLEAGARVGLHIFGRAQQLQVVGVSWVGGWDLSFAGQMPGNTGNPGPLTARASGFWELDAQRTDERRLHEVISKIGTSKILGYEKQLANRLRELSEAYKDDFDNRPLSADSTMFLFRFLCKTTHLRCPSVVATPAGTLLARWKTGPDRLLSINFLPSGDVHFVLFRPNQRHLGHTDRIFVSTTFDALEEGLTANDALELATR